MKQNISDKGKEQIHELRMEGVGSSGLGIIKKGGLN